MNKEDTRDIIDQGHPPDVERLLLELELNLNFLKFLEQREKKELNDLLKGDEER